jgi:hypothetical protein
MKTTNKNVEMTYLKCLRVIRALSAIVVLCSLLCVADCYNGRSKGLWVSHFCKIQDKEIETNSQEYIIKFSVYGIMKKISINKMDYNNITIGDEIQVEEGIGGWTHWKYGYSFKNKVTGLPLEQ